MRFDHLGIAVETLEAGRQVLGHSLRVGQWTTMAIDPVQNVHYQFGLDPSGVRYELLAPASDTSPIWRAVRTKSRTLNHVAYRVNNLDTTALDLVAQHWTTVSQVALAPAFDGARIQFLLNPLGFVVELIEDLPEPIGG